MARACGANGPCVAEQGELAERRPAPPGCLPGLPFLLRFADGADDDDILDLALRARVNSAICLGRFGENAEALSIYAEVLDEPVDLERESRVEDLVRAVINHTNTLRGLGRPDKAVALLWRSAERIAGSKTAFALLTSRSFRWRTRGAS